MGGWGRRGKGRERKWRKKQIEFRMLQDIKCKVLDEEKNTGEGRVVEQRF